MKYLEDIHAGQCVEFPGRYTVTEDNITATGREWDPFPFHTDPDAAASGFYGGLVASTVQLFAITVKLGHSAAEVLDAVGSLGIDELKNHAPARPGDVLKCKATYLDIRESRSRPGMGIMSARSELTNQRDELIFSYITTALYRMRPG